MLTPFENLGHTGRRGEKEITTVMVQRKQNIKLFKYKPYTGNMLILMWYINQLKINYYLAAQRVKKKG